MTAATQTLLGRMRTHLPASALPLWDAAQAWLAAHALLVSVIGGLSVLLSVAAVTLTPFVIARLPADFFLRLTRPPAPVLRRPHPVWEVHTGDINIAMLATVLGTGHEHLALGHHRLDAHRARDVRPVERGALRHRVIALVDRPRVGAEAERQVSREAERGWV